MKTRFTWAAGAIAALLAGCTSPHLALSVVGAVTVPAGSAVAFQALAQDSDGTIQWTLDGPGVLTPNVGNQVTYFAPTTYTGDVSATVTVTLSDAPDETKVIQINVVKPSDTVGGIPVLTTEVDVPGAGWP